MSANQEMELAASKWHRQALDRWENEGGDVAVAAARRPSPDDPQRDIPALADAELTQLRIRVIALESLLVALLTEASERQLCTARDMASYIAPRPGFTPHKLTVQAKSHIIDLIERAARFDSADPPKGRSP
ncbi:MAG: hypothetical protein ABI216_19745 [Devosia sp.]